AEGGAVDPALLEDGAEKTLFETFERVRGDLAAAWERRDYTESLALVARELKEPIDRFFDDVLVMADDEALRSNRLRLLKNIADAVTQVAHIHVLGS
ncbi:MAG: glycine--tRNA ligase subunit beta, partial [Sandaracinus sp.]|nr:glycine--tRNA ligase subunit beta [Sandaracinus sp.]